MIAVLLIALLTSPQEKPEFARVRSLEVESGHHADHAALADLDGDGAPEVLLAVHEPEKEFARRLETWKLDANREPRRAESLALTPDVVAFALADVLGGGGDELVLFNAGGAFVWRSGPEARPLRLLEAEFLWQTPDPELVFEWASGVRDLDGDGLVDLVLPEPGGFMVALQRRSSDPPETEKTAPWGVVSRLRVPTDPGDPGVWTRPEPEREGVESSSDNGTFSLGFRSSDGGPERGAGTLVSVRERVPAPFWLDWDADSDLDLLLQSSRSLHVWLQDARSSFTGAPQHSLTLPVAADEKRELDASYSAHALDLDLDRRADCVVFAGDKRSDDVRAQGLFFVQGSGQGSTGAGPALFGEAGKPSSLLVFAGFVSDPAFRDLDGDGYPELVVRTIRPDLIDQIRSASSESIDTDLFVYRNRGGVLARQPELKRSQAMPLDDFEVSAEFVGDLTGDGMSELLVRDEPERLRLLMLRAQGKGEKSAWSLIEKPLWELSIAKDSRVEVARERSGTGVSLFVLEPRQVLWVRFE